MRRFWSLTRWILVVALLFFPESSCTVKVGGGPYLVGKYLNSDEDVKAAKKNNSEFLTRTYAREADFYRHRHQPAKTAGPAGQSGAETPYEGPEYCIAMSGGGSRSAAFNIGVLAGLSDLHDKNKDTGKDETILDKVDTISSVSGGSYASGWYFAQHYNEYNPEKNQSSSQTQAIPSEDEFQRKLFDPGPNGTYPDGTYQGWIAGRSSVIPLYVQAEGILSDVAFIPVNLFANGLFGWHANTTPGRRIYQGRLERTYFEGPERNVSITFPDLAAFVYDRNLPLPIVDTSALIYDDAMHHGSLMGNSVFEFTPYSYGSDAYSYTHEPEEDCTSKVSYKRSLYTGDKPVDFATAVAISGAALDTPNVVQGASQQMFFSALNADTGYNIPNKNQCPKTTLPEMLIPFPFYYPYGWARDMTGHSIYLTDGGYSDNLAAYGAVRRLCKNIIIVDAETDPLYTFSSYYKLKNAVRSEMGARLSVDGIYEDPADATNNPAEVTDQPPGWRFDNSKPIMKGRVESFPLGETNVSLNVAYIKLSGSKDDSPKYGRNTRADWENDEKCRAEQTKYKKSDADYPSCFPHTHSESLTKSQYLGLVELGRAIVHAHREELLEGIGMRPEEAKQVWSCFDTISNTETCK
jgi:hypothetical protein